MRMSIKEKINDLIDKYYNYRNEHLIKLLNQRLGEFKSFQTNKEISIGKLVTPVNTGTYNTIEENVYITNRGYEEVTIKQRKEGDNIEIWEVTRRIIPKEKYIEMLKKYDKENVFKVNKNYVLELFK
jgi:hypothetical protein